MPSYAVKVQMHRSAEEGSANAEGLITLGKGSGDVLQNAFITLRSQ